MADGDAITMLSNVGELMNDMIGFIDIPAYVVGACCVASGLFTMASQRTEGATGKGITLLLIGGIFAGLPYFIGDLGESLLSLKEQNAILSSDTTGSGSSVKAAALTAIFAILRFVGICAIWKGCNRLKFYNMSPNGDPRLVSEAMTLLFMGTLAVFSKEFVTALSISIGGSFQTNVEQFLETKLGNP